MNEDDLRQAVEAATGGDIARRIEDATVGVTMRALMQSVDPSVLFELDEAFGFPGTQDDPLRAVADATQESVRAAVEDALRRLG